MKLKILAGIIMLTSWCLTASGQGLLAFEETQRNFGDIKEADGKVSHTFVCENIGNEPIVIINITTSCGCTTPDYSKKPIMPGQRSQIIVWFDPINRPGTFAKELGVFSSDRKKAATLVVRGNVTPRPKSINETYPIETGTGLRLDSNFSTHSYVYHGSVSQAFIGIVNTSDKPLTLDIRPDMKSGLLSIDYPKQIAAGAKAEIRLVYDVSKESTKYGTLTDILSIYVNGRKVSPSISVHGLAVDNPNKMQGSKKPKSSIDKSIVRFGEQKIGSSVPPQSVVLSNSGDAPLIIRAVETGSGTTCSVKSGQKIAAGTHLNVKITIIPSKMELGPVSENITLFTNDPTRPMRKIRVTAIIEN